MVTRPSIDFDALRFARPRASVACSTTGALWPKSEGDHKSDQEGDAHRHHLTESRFRVRRLVD
jgi:hypothetical protein